MNSQSVRLLGWITLLFALFFAAASQGQGNFVFNGMFTNNAIGWTLTNEAFSSLGTVVLDNISPSPSTDPTAGQTIAGLTPGDIYIISGDYRAEKDRGGSSTDASFGIALDGVWQFQASLSFPSAWNHFNFSYIATSGTALLSFAGQMNGSGQSYAIANVSMALIPEPSALTLFGLCGFLFAAQRLHKR